MFSSIRASTPLGDVTSKITVATLSGDSIAIPLSVGSGTHDSGTLTEITGLSSGILIVLAGTMAAVRMMVMKRAIAKPVLVISSQLQLKTNQELRARHVRQRRT